MQFVFVDEKTFKGGEVKEHIGDYGYAAKGHRVPLRYVIVGQVSCLIEWPRLSAH